MKDFKKYEATAKLSLNEEEREWVSERADMLIKSFRELEAVDTENTESLITVLEIQNVFREDMCDKMISRDELLKNAPEQYEGYFRVPKTVG